MSARSTSTIVVGLATLIAVFGVSYLLGVNFWLAAIIALICALAAQFVTSWQGRR